MTKMRTFARRGKSEIEWFPLGKSFMRVANMTVAEVPPNGPHRRRRRCRKWKCSALCAGPSDGKAVCRGAGGGHDSRRVGAHALRAAVAPGSRRFAQAQAGHGASFAT